MTNKKRVLVLLSSYNGEKYIEAQIRSILNQTIAAQIHIRIRDDGSNDRTCEIIKRLKLDYPNKIELNEEENLGCNAGFFELLNNAEGYDYYSLSDQDDIWLSSKLETALAVLEAEDTSIPLLYASTSYLVEDDLVPYGQTRRKERDFSIYNTAIQNICPGHTQVINNALLKIIQEEDIDLNRIYVYDSWIVNLAALYGKILFNNSSFTYYRQHKYNQLGSGAGKIGQLLVSVKRNGTGDGYKYREQVKYLVEMNEDILKIQGSYDELNNFLNAKSMKEKICYIWSSKLYRQSKLETFILKIAILANCI